VASHCLGASLANNTEDRGRSGNGPQEEEVGLEAFEEEMNAQSAVKRLVE